MVSQSGMLPSCRMDCKSHRVGREQMCIHQKCSEGAVAYVGINRSVLLTEAAN